MKRVLGVLLTAALLLQAAPMAVWAQGDISFGGEPQQKEETPAKKPHKKPHKKPAEEKLPEGETAPETPEGELVPETETPEAEIAPETPEAEVVPETETPEGEITPEEPLAAPKAKVLGQGTCGPNAKWVLYGTGELNITGQGNITNEPWGTEKYQTRIRSVTIEEGITGIPYGTFSGCDNITHISLPKSMTNIEAEFNSYSLVRVTYAGTRRQWATSNMHKKENESSSYEITNEKICAEGKVSCSDGVFKGGMYTYKPNTAHNGIAITSYYGIMESSKLQLPDTIDGQKVTDIGWRAFSGCKNLTSVTIPEGVVTIGGYAFSECTSLTSVTIPEGVTSIDYRAFYDCASLMDITIPASVTEIWSDAFENCPSLKNITYGGTRQQWAAIHHYDNEPYYEGVTITCSDGVVTDWFYTYEPNNTDGGITITGYSGTMKEKKLLIPDTIDGQKVTAIGESAFSGCQNLTSVTIPQGVVTIGHYAFYSCTSLTSATIPEGVTTIEQSTFSDCTSLTSVTIPEGVTTIGYDAFSGCTSLTDITIPSSVTEIWSDAFQNCPSLKNITYGGTKQQWAAIAHHDNESYYEGVTITCSDGVVTDWFYTYEPNNTDGGITITGYCGTMKEKKLLIPDTIDGQKVTAIGDRAFGGNDILEEVVVSENVRRIAGFSGCTSLRKITLPSRLRAIEDDAFNGCTSLTAITIPDTVTEIGDEAFEGSGLTSIVLPDSVTTLGEGSFSGAFRDCKNLQTVKLSSGLTEIHGLTFSGCTSLTDINIPDSVTDIGQDAFENCTSLTSITIPDSVDYMWYGGTFKGCTSLRNVTLSRNLDCIYAGTFQNCVSLETITLPASVYDVEEYAFAGCSALRSVNFSDHIDSIGANAFLGCTSLQKLALPAPLRTLGERAFSGCTGLRSLSLPEGTVDIGPWAFEDCAAVTTVELPLSVTAIGMGAFSGCNGLTDVYYAGSPAEWETISIGSYNEPLLSAARHNQSPGKPAGVVLDGVIKAPGNPNTLTTVELWQDGSLITSVLADGDGRYSLKSVDPGQYELHYVKKGYVTRTVPVTVSNVPLTLPETFIRLKGDISGDGRLKANDVTILFDSLTTTTDPYEISCYDMSGDGRLKANDVTILFDQLGQM